MARHLQFSSPPPAAAGPAQLEQGLFCTAGHVEAHTPPSQGTSGAPSFGMYAPLKAPAHPPSRLTASAVKAAKRLAPAFGLAETATAPPSPAPGAPLSQLLGAPSSRDKLLAGAMRAVARRAAGAGAAGARLSHGAAMTARMLSPPPAPPSAAWGAGGTPDAIAGTPGPPGSAVRQLTFASPPPVTPPAHYEGMRPDEGVPQVGPSDDASTRSDSPDAPPRDSGSIDGSFEVPATPLQRRPRAGVVAAVALPPSLGFVAGQSPAPAPATTHRRRRQAKTPAASKAKASASATKTERKTRNKSRRSAKKHSSAPPPAAPAPLAAGTAIGLGTAHRTGGYQRL